MTPDIRESHLALQDIRKSYGASSAEYKKTLEKVLNHKE